MRENGTPLTATSIKLSYHQGWFIDSAGNRYDRIYLSYSYYRYQGSLNKIGSVDEVGNPIVCHRIRVMAVG